MNEIKISSTRWIVFASFKSGHDGVGAWDDEQGEQGGNEDASDDGQRHGLPCFRPGSDAQRDGKRRGYCRCGCHQDRSQPYRGCRHDRLDQWHALSALTIHELDQKNRIFLYNTHQKDDADGAVEIQRLVGAPQIGRAHV